MTQHIILSSELFSLRGQVWIKNIDGKVLFGAKRASVFSKELRIRNTSGEQLISLLPQPWKVDPSWQIGGQLGDFVIKREKKSFERSYWLESGQFDGAVIEGGSQDTAFRIRHNDKVIAQARQASLSLKSEHTIDVEDESYEALLLTSLAAIVVLKEKQASRQA